MSKSRKLLVFGLAVFSVLSIYGSQVVSYEYNIRGQVIKQRVNGADIVFGYDKLGRLKTKTLSSKKMSIAKIEYFYGENGQIAALEVNGIKQAYEYDALGQLLSVTAGSRVLELYKYDPAGNMLSKTINGKSTTYKYDASNQLVSSTLGGKTTTYEYDAAGRMIQEGATFYSYNFANKVVKSGENSYDYYATGQIARMSSANGTEENFTWDRLALLERNNTTYLNEPYATGGNPVLATTNNTNNTKVLFNDMLGTTQGSISQNGKYQATNKTAFGAGNKSMFFTGKPYVEGLGSVFLFRNYRPELGKWTSSDPLGYPDGWNNLAYVNNRVTQFIDWLGTVHLNLYPTDERIHDSANKTNDTGGNYRIGAHGDADGIDDQNGDPVTPQQLATMIQNDSNYTGQNIDLLSCNVGNGTYAQELANILNVNVGAPNNYIWYETDGNVFVAGITPEGNPDYNDYGNMTRKDPVTE